MKKILFSYIIVSFVLNFIWEVNQVGLYSPHFNGIADLVLVHLKAAAGDVIILLIIYTMISFILRDMSWITKNRAVPLVVTAILGFIFSVIVEKYALVTGRWKYSEIMPIIPYIKVGLIPVLQLTILTPLSVFAARRYAASQMK